MKPRKKRSDYVSGDGYARNLYQDGVDYEHIRSGAGFGTGPYAERLRAIWGDDPNKTLELEAAEQASKPHVFTKKWGHRRRGKVAGGRPQAPNPFHTK